MAFKIFMLGLHTSPEQELNKFIKTHKIVSIDKEFVNNGMQSFWSFCINYLGDGTVMFFKESKIDHTASLSPENLVVYEKLRTIRNLISKDLGIPAYAVFTNEEISILSKESSITAKSLENLKGFGEGRMEKTGKIFLKSWHEKSEEPLPQN